MNNIYGSEVLVGRSFKQAPIRYGVFMGNKSKKPKLTNSQYYLEEICKATGYNIAQVSKFSGISRTTINRLANGSSKNLNIENFSRLLNLYLKITRSK